MVRPEDPHAAAVELRRLAQDPPAFLPPALRRVVALGGMTSRVAPSLVVPTAQAAMRRMVSHLILDARSAPLTASISRLTADGTTLNINLLGEAMLGAQEASRRLQGVREIVARDDVDYASIKVSSIVDHLPLWAAAQTVDHIVETLLPLYLDSARSDRPTFLNMDMEEYQDLELTLQVFEKLLDRPELEQLPRRHRAARPTCPTPRRAMARVRRFAERRVADGRSAGEGASGQGREPRHGAGRGLCARLDPGAADEQGGDGRAVQADPARRPAPRAARGRARRAWPATTSSMSPSRTC